MSIILKPTCSYLFQESDMTEGKKLGLLGGTFEDGSFSVFVVPDPSNFSSPEGDTALPVCSKLNFYN